SHHWRPVLAGLLALLAAGYALSGLTWVGPDERAVVLRFGRPVEDLGPGLYYRWPWPFEEALRFQPERLRTVAVRFRTGPGGGLGQRPRRRRRARARRGGHDHRRRQSRRGAGDGALPHPRPAGVLVPRGRSGPGGARRGRVHPAPGGGGAAVPGAADPEAAAV